jgi:hypothetical protein
MMEEGDISCLSVADKFIASGSVFGNMERLGDNRDARCTDYGNKWKRLSPNRV